MGFGLRQISLSPIDLGLVWPRVDFVQHIALLHVGSFFEINLVEVAGHVRTNFDLRLGHRAAGEIFVVGHFVGHRGFDGDHGGFWRRHALRRRRRIVASRCQRRQKCRGGDDEAALQRTEVFEWICHGM